MAVPNAARPGKAPPPNQARLKVVIRRLPPDLPEAVFWKSVSPWVVPHVAETTSAVEGEPGDGAGAARGDRAVVWSKYKCGKVRRSGKDKDDVHSRAYITFKTVEDLVAFHQGYDGWSFKSKTGNISQAVVEFAPYQKTPILSAKADPRQSTIEQDPDYASFLVQLEAPEVVEKVEPTPAVDKKKPQSTPLLDHLRAQKLAERRQSKRPAVPVASTSGSSAKPNPKQRAGFPSFARGGSTPASESSSSLGKKGGAKNAGKGKGKMDSTGSTKAKGKGPRPNQPVQPRPPNMNSFPAFPPLLVNSNLAPTAPTAILQSTKPTSILPPPRSSKQLPIGPILIPPPRPPPNLPPLQTSSGQASTAPLANRIPSPSKSALPPIATNFAPPNPTFPPTKPNFHPNNPQHNNPRQQNQQQHAVSPARLSPQEQQSLSLQLGIHQGMQQIKIAQEIVAQQMKMASPTGSQGQQLPFPPPTPQQQQRFNLPPVVKQQPIRILAKPPTGPASSGPPRQPMQQPNQSQQSQHHPQQQQQQQQRPQRLPAFLQNQQPNAQNRPGPSSQHQSNPAQAQGGGPPTSQQSNQNPNSGGKGRGGRAVRGGGVGGGEGGMMGQRRTLDAALGAALDGNNSKKKGRGNGNAAPPPPPPSS